MMADSHNQLVDPNQIVLLHFFRSTGKDDPPI